MDGHLGGYLLTGLLLAAGVVFVVVAMLANRILRPHRPTYEKRTTYESGVDPVTGGWAQANIRYYLYAFLYLIFAVEAIFLFPWAVVFVGLGVPAVVEMGVFIGLLALGLLYAWKKQVLRWE